MIRIPSFQPKGYLFSNPYELKNLSCQGISKRSLISSPTKDVKKEKVVILGSGWAGYRFAKDLPKNHYEVTMLSPRNHFLFTPLLPSTTVGTLEFRSICEPVRHIQDMTYYQASAKSINFSEKTVECRNSFDQSIYSVPYDYLIICVGARNKTFGIPGVEENAYFLKELLDARKIRNRILECFERASEPNVSPSEKQKLLSFYVVGGGPTGVEFCSELYDFLKEDIQKAFPSLYSMCQVSLLEASDSLLNAFDKKLAAYAMKTFSKRNIRVYTHVKISKMTPEEIYFSDGTSLKYGLCVWNTGVEPNPFVKSLNIEKSRDGRILVDDHLNLLGMKDVFGLGDCAVVQSAPLPCTAQVANQQATYLVKRFVNMSNEKETKPFSYVHKGMLAYIGRYSAITDLSSTKLSGFASWLIWRGAYLTNLVSWANKILVPMIWIKTFIFGRDVTRFENSSSFEQPPQKKKEEDQ